MAAAPLADMTGEIDRLGYWGLDPFAFLGMGSRSSADRPLVRHGFKSPFVVADGPSEGHVVFAGFHIDICKTLALRALDSLNMDAL